MLTLVFISVALVLLGSICRWASSSSALTARNNVYNSTVAAAEAATELVIAQMDRDFLHQALNANVSAYDGILPGSVVRDSWPADYQFSDGHGNVSKTAVVCANWQVWTNLDSEFTGLYGMVNSFQVTADAKKITGPFPVAAGVSQNFQLTAIPIFQFAIYYAMDLEIDPAPPMVVTGKTHGNANIYIAPTSTLEFVDTVGAVGHIYYQRASNDPTPGNMPVYDSTHLEQVSSLTLPVGTDNNPSNVVKILDPPAPYEDPASEMGTQRYYNKSDLVITTKTNTVIVQFNNYQDGTTFTLVPTNSVAGPTNSGYSFVNTNVTFFDYREGRQVLATEIDVGALTNWLASSNGYSFNSTVQSHTGHHINSIYVNDQRSVPGKLTAVRVANGQNLPDSGLTVATPLPLYVKGNYNAPDLTPGSTNTSLTEPASLAGDSITILSPSWKDSWISSTSLSSRNAANTTVNAAFLAGIVPSVTAAGGQMHYSGGVENFPRFLENWTGKTLTYNGSMVVMFPSRYATNFWVNPGTYYNPPTRKWAFDSNFLNFNKLPSATPQVRKLQRSQWSVVAANSN